MLPPPGPSVYFFDFSRLRQSLASMMIAIILTISFFRVDVLPLFSLLFVISSSRYFPVFDPSCDMEFSSLVFHPSKDFPFRLVFHYHQSFTFFRIFFFLPPSPPRSDFPSRPLRFSYFYFPMSFPPVLARVGKSYYPLGFSLSLFEASRLSSSGTFRWSQPSCWTNGPWPFAPTFLSPALGNLR